MEDEEEDDDVARAVLLRVDELDEDTGALDDEEDIGALLDEAGTLLDEAGTLLDEEEDAGALLDDEEDAEALLDEEEEELPIVARVTLLRNKKGKNAFAVPTTVTEPE